MVSPAATRRHNTGLSKAAADFVHHPKHSTLWSHGPEISSSEIQSQDLFRFHSNNVNGFSKADNEADLKDYTKRMNGLNVAVCAMQEVNRNFELQSTRDAMFRHVRGTSIHHHGVFGQAKLGDTSSYQPGGTGVVVRDKWATRFLAKGADDLGRWSWLTLTGNGTTRITFISVYRVCDGSAQEPSTARTVRSQQQSLYARRGITGVDLRTRVITDLIAFIGKLRKDGHFVVVSINAN